MVLTSSIAARDNVEAFPIDLDANRMFQLCGFTSTGLPHGFSLALGPPGTCPLICILAWCSGVPAGAPHSAELGRIGTGIPLGCVIE